MRRRADLRRGAGGADGAHARGGRGHGRASDRIRADHGACHALVCAGALRHRCARGRPRRRAGFHQRHRLPGACRDLQPGLRSHRDPRRHACADRRGEGRDPEGRRLRALRRSAAGGGGRHPGALRRDRDASAHAGFRAAAHRAARADRSGLRLRRAKGAGAAASGAASAKKRRRRADGGGRSAAEGLGAARGGRAARSGRNGLAGALRAAANAAAGLCRRRPQPAVYAGAGAESARLSARTVDHGADRRHGRQAI